MVEGSKEPLIDNTRSKKWRPKEAKRRAKSEYKNEEV